MNKNTIFGLNSNLINHIESISKEFIDIINPLLENSPISHFTYWKVFRSGHYFGLGNHLGIMKAYFNHHMSNNQQHFLEELRYIEDGSSYKYLWPLNNIDKIPGLNICHQFDVFNGMNVNYGYKDYIERFVFAAPIEFDKVTDLYLNHFDILERFIIYFKNKAKHLIDLVDTNSCTFSPLFHGDQNDKNKINKSLMGINKENFVKNTEIKKFYLQTHPRIRLSYKEVESLHYISLGVSPKEIANILNVSHRTIEKHLANIKSKCNLNFINELKKLYLKNNLHQFHISSAKSLKT